MKAVAVVTTHPIQYQVPWLQRLAARDDIDLRVFFAMIPDPAEQGREFGVSFAWDVPLLDGYSYAVMKNVARKPSLTSYRGCDTPQLYDEIRRGRFAAVIVNGWIAKSCLQALLACRLSGTPCIVRGEVNGLRPRPAWKRLLHRLLFTQYSAFLSIGSHNRDYYLRSGVSSSSIFPTPYCVDNERFAAATDRWRSERGHTWLRERFGLTEDRITFLFSGKFVEKKRPGDIIAAIRQLDPSEMARLQILMVGDGPLSAELRKAAEGLPVRFAGFLNQSEITAAYAASDCLVLPSDHGETWGLVVNEAMACGLPAIVSDQVGSAVDLIDAGLTGDRFPCGDVQALAEKLREYSSQPERLSKMALAARERVHSSYNFERVVDGVLAALTSNDRTPV